MVVSSPLPVKDTFPYYLNRSIPQLVVKRPVVQQNRRIQLTAEFYWKFRKDAREYSINGRSSALNE